MSRPIMDPVTRIANKMLREIKKLKAIDPDAALKLQAALGGNGSTEPSIKAPINLVEASKNEQQRQRDEKHFWVTILNNSGDDMDYCYVGPAEGSYWLPFNERAPVPQSVISVLESAIRFEHKFERPDPNGPPVDTVKAIRRFPYSVHGPATKEETMNYWIEKKRQQEPSQQAAYSNALPRLNV